MDLKHFVKVSLLYILMMFGGIWHILGYFETIMHVMAAPLIIGIGLWLFYENFLLLDDIRRRIRFIQWSIFVVIFTIFIEWVGVRTGLIFGEYSYGPTLFPFIDDVPISIGFAWLGMLLASIALSQKIFPEFTAGKVASTALISGVLMTVFDAFMEPAAVALNYWTWSGATVPMQNYAAWFIISLLLTLAGLKAGLFKKQLSIYGVHAYVAQLIYFILVYFS